MISLYNLAVEVNKQTDEVLRHVDDLCKEWGEEKVILLKGTGESSTVMLSDEADREIRRRT